METTVKQEFQTLNDTIALPQRERLQPSDEPPFIKPSLVQIATSQDTEQSAAAKAMERQLAEIRHDLEVSQQLVIELSKPPVEMVYVPREFLAKLRDHYASSLETLNNLLLDD